MCYLIRHHGYFRSPLFTHLSHPNPSPAGLTLLKMPHVANRLILFFLSSELDSYRSGGDPPQTDITLCFGEELMDGDDLSDKHIIIKVQTSHVWCTYGCKIYPFSFLLNSFLHFWHHLNVVFLQISLPWAQSQIQEVQTFRDSIAILKSLASQSPTGEVTLSFVDVAEQQLTSP